MINQKVIDMLVWVYSLFDIKLLTVIATAFTIYFGFQKVTKRICVSYSMGASRLYDSHVSNLVVSNKRDNSVIIFSINLRIGRKGNIELVKFEEPLVLKGYESKAIEVPKYSSLYGNDGAVTIDILEPLFFSITTMEGDIIECDVESPLNPEGLDDRLHKRTVVFNDIVLTERMGVIFSYFLNGESKNVIIDRTGFISGSTPFRGNMFNDLSKEYFQDLFINEGYHDYFDNYAFHRVNHNLQTELFLSKAMVSEIVKN